MYDTDCILPASKYYWPRHSLKIKKLHDSKSYNGPKQSPQNKHVNVYEIKHVKFHQSVKGPFD